MFNYFKKTRKPEVENLVVSGTKIFALKGLLNLLMVNGLRVIDV
jgi:hypothetical protein